MRDRHALPLLAVTALLWSSGGLAIKLVDLPPLALTGARSALAALVLGCFLRGRARPSWSRAELLGAAAYAAMLLTNVAATKLTTAANAILLAYTAPVYVALAAPRLLGERTRPSDWAFIAATLGGMVLFFLDKLSGSGLVGNLLAVGTGLAYAGFTLAMRAQREGEPLRTPFLGHVLAALAGLPFLPADLSALAPGLASTPGLAAGLAAGLLYLGLVQQGLSLVLYSSSIRHVPALAAILVMTLEPVLNPVWVALGTGELPGAFALAGGLVVLCAVTARGLLGVRAEARARRATA